MKSSTIYYLSVAAFTLYAIASGDFSQPFNFLLRFIGGTLFAVVIAKFYELLKKGKE